MKNRIEVKIKKRSKKAKFKTEESRRGEVCLTSYKMFTLKTRLLIVRKKENKKV